VKATDFILLRHGEPELRDCFLGRLDSPATQRGIDSCINAVSGIDIGHIISSPLQRSAAAAQAIAASLGLQVDLDSRWQELDFGAWDGRSAQAIGQVEARELHDFWTDPDLHPPPGGERWSQIKDRVSAAMNETAKRSFKRPVLVVSHAGAIRAALAVACSFGFAETMRLDLPYAAQVHLTMFDEPGATPSGLIRRLVSA
jgi:alpha-ribazole phosphatase